MAQTVQNKKNKLGGALEIALLGVGAVALFSGLFYSAQAGIFVLCAGWVVALTWLYPKQAFWLLLFFAPLLPLLKTTQVLSAVTPLKDFVIVTLFVGVVLYPIYLKKDPYRRNAVLLPILFLCGYAVLATLKADSYLLGLLRLRDILLYLPLLWVARALIVTRRDFSDFLKVIFGALVLVLTLVIAQFAFFADGMVMRFVPQGNAWIGRASSTLAHPNILGSYLLCLLPLVISFGWQRFKTNWKNKVLLFIGVAGLVAVYATYSRGVWIAFAVSAFAVGVMFVSQKKALFYKVVLPVVLVLVLVIVAVPRTRSLLRTAIDPTYASNQDRIEIMASLVSELSNADALFGKGLGDVIQSTNRTIDLSLTDIASNNVQSIQTAKASTFVDNAVLKTLIETGLAGLLIVGWLVWTIIRTTWTSATRSDTNEEKYFGLGLFATTVGLLVLAFFLDIPEIFPVALYWWTLVGVAQAVPYTMNDE